MAKAAVLVELIGGPRTVVEVDLEIPAARVAALVAEALDRSIQNDDGSEKLWKIYAPNRSGGFAPLPPVGTLEAAARAIKKKVDGGSDAGFAGPGEHEGKSYAFRIRFFVPSAPPPIQEPKSPTVSDDEVIDLTNLDVDDEFESIRRNPERARKRKKKRTGPEGASKSGTIRKGKKRDGKRATQATGEIRKRKRRRKSVADEDAPIESSVADEQPAEQESVADEQPAQQDSVADEQPAQQQSVADEQPAQQDSVADEQPAQQDSVADEQPAQQQSVADEQETQEASVADEQPAEQESVTDEQPAGEDSGPSEVPDAEESIDTERSETPEEEVVPTVRQEGLEASEEEPQPEQVDTSRRVVTTSPPDVEAPKPGDVAVTSPFAPTLDEKTPGPLSPTGGRAGRKKKAKKGRGGLVVGLVISLGVVAALIVWLLGELAGPPTETVEQIEKQEPAAAQTAPARLSDDLKIAPFPGAPEGADDPVATLIEQFKNLSAGTPADLATAEHVSSVREWVAELKPLCSDGRWDACAAQSRLSLALHRACQSGGCEPGAADGAIGDAISGLSEAFAHVKSVEDPALLKAGKNRLILQVVRVAGTDWELLKQQLPKLSKVAQRLCGSETYKSQPDCSDATAAGP